MLNALTNFHFIRPWWLLLIPVIVGVWWFWQRQSDPLRGWRAQMAADLLQALIVKQTTTHYRTDRWWLAGWLLAVLAVAGPTWRLEPSPFAEDSAPLMILLKASDSMDRGDVSNSLIERARLKISDLAEVRKGQPLGLIAYAGSAHLVLPPTRDTGVVAQMAAEISPDVMPVPGDRLDLALRKASEILSSEEAGGTVLVIADSVDGGTEAIAREWSRMKKFPVQFLALSDEESQAAASLEQAAQTLDAAMQHLTVDNGDVTALAHAAARHSLTGIAGKSTRWQEAGYWLVPLLAFLVALSFRREAPSSEKERR